MALILLRHTTPKVATGVCYGQTDLPLADSFEREAQAVLETLPELEAIITSPLTRCRKLAEFIASQSGLTVVQDARVMELDFGAWEGVSWDNIPRNEIDEWADDVLHARPHGGESVAMLRDRSMTALKGWQARYNQPLIVTHAGVIKAALSKGETAEDFATKIDFGAHVTISTL